VTPVVVKGAPLLSCERYLGEHFGPEAWRRLLAELTPQERSELSPAVLATSRYPFALFLKVIRVAKQLFGGQEPRLHDKMGRASADYGLTTVYKIFFKVGSPQFIISKAPKVWKAYYNSGDLRSLVSEPGHAVMELAGFEEPALELCERLTGWFTRTLELAGAAEPKLVHTECVHRGAGTCRWEGWWS
jgi:hypothetical protein